MSSVAKLSEKAFSSNEKYQQAVDMATKDGLQIVDVASDSACLFRAVGVCTAGNEDKHLTLRSECIKYMKDHFDEFKEIARVDLDENLSFEKYLAKIASPSALIEE